MSRPPLPFLQTWGMNFGDVARFPPPLFVDPYLKKIG